MLQTTQSPSGEYRKLWTNGKSPSVKQLFQLCQTIPPPKQVELIILDQSMRWDANEQVTAEEYFGIFPDLQNHPEFAIDVVYSEFLLRERLGLHPVIDEYMVRFPQFADELQSQDAFHRAMGLSSMDLDTDFPSRFKSPVDGFTATNLGVPEVPGYQILSELGRGGIGIVYKARHLQLNRYVALKMLLAGHFASPNLLRRFFVEAEATARLQHPNIVQIYEVGQIEGCPFLALEFVNGGTLSQSVNGRPLPPREAVSIVKQLARAVHFAHEQGVVHRDLKPGNVLIQKLSSSHGSDAE
ncbi:MAG: serine/threonine-protein kinase, partial [Pirellula sp.]